jgi:cyanophycinase-like exopeptidase
MKRVGLLILAMATGLCAQAHGPRNGWLLIGGGGTGHSRGTKRFLEMLGGKGKARIVVIPTASVTQALPAAKLKSLCTGNFGGAQCTVLHTVNRALADSEDFVAPLKTANGVWLEGGRQWRLADAYLGTRTLTEILAVLDRGGVVAGGSAGASIQGSYVVRGSSTPDDRLKGSYDIKLEWTRPPQLGDAMAAADIPEHPGFLHAMQEQLGLKSETRKGPMDVAVVDHAEQTPRAN